MLPAREESVEAVVSNTLQTLSLRAKVPDVELGLLRDFTAVADRLEKHLETVLIEEGIGKLVNIQVPFLFKDIVDALTISPDMAVANAAAQDPALVVPMALVLGYGVARFTAQGFQELRNAVFSTVAQRTIRKVGGVGG